MVLLIPDNNELKNYNNLINFLSKFNETDSSNELILNNSKFTIEE